MNVRRLSILPLLAVSTFLGAALLFFLQPMFGKIILPRFGGAPAVWITALVFFQLMLLAGYIYVHLTVRWLGAHRQTLLHAVVMLVPLAFLPIRMISADGLVSPQHPIASVFIVLLGSVGLPFFAVSTTAPLLQRWFGNTRHPRASDPFFLYAASNLGSIGGLLIYPFLIEPRFTLDTQIRLWSWGYCLLATLTMACIVIVRRSAIPLVERNHDREELPSVDWLTRTRWVILSAIPSSLLLSVTSHVTIDIAPIPLLWVIPLAIYLCTFVLAFSDRAAALVRFAWHIAPFVVVIPLVILVSDFREPPGFILFHLAAFLVASIVCHGQLAASRPGVRDLTEFYVWIALGGAAGGLFDLVVAPMIFRTFLEYPLGLILACLVRAPRDSDGRAFQLRLSTVAIPLTIGLAVLLAEFGARLGQIPRGSLPFTVLVFALPVGATLALYRKTRLFALSLAAIALAAIFPKDPRDKSLHTERSFYGVRRVANHGVYRSLVNGNIDHGSQSLRANRKCLPLSYFYPTGPLGDVFSIVKDRQGLDIAIIGLGTGSIGGYAKPDQRWTFYEIDPSIERIARNARYFTFLRDCAPQARVILGDARLSLAQQQNVRHDLIVIDAFNSDAIPMHLLTREAMQLYVSKLAPNGLIAFHISNKYVNLRRVLGRLARDAQFTAFVRDDRRITPLEAYDGKLASVWVVMSKSASDLGSLETTGGWLKFPSDVAGPSWTDDYSNVFETLKLGM